MAGETGNDRDLAYYIDHPEELNDAEMRRIGLDEGSGPTEDDSSGGTINEALAQAEGDKAGKEAASDATKTEHQADPAKGQQQEDAKQGQQGEPPQVVRSKDGKHEIPYTVLDTERKARADAERKLQEATQLLEQLKQQAATANQPGKEPQKEQQQDAPLLSDEEIGQIESDFPAMGKLLKSMTGQIAQLSQQLTQVRDSEQQRRSTEAQRSALTVQEAIDANPKVAHLQAERGESWKQLVNIDNLLKQDPRNQSLTFSERFDKAVRMLEADIGEIQVPGAKPNQATQQQQDPGAGKTAPPAAAKPSAAAQKAIADAEAALERAKREAGVTSLSAIPGGATPNTDPLETLGALDATELGNQMLSMDDLKLKQLLAKLG